MTDFASFSTDIIDDSFYNDVVFVRPQLGSAISGSNFNSIKSISRSNASKNNSINIGILLADVFYPYSIDKNSSVYKEFFKFTKSIQNKVAKANIIHSRLTALLNSKIVNHSKNDFKDIKQKLVDYDSVFDYRNVSDMSVILKFSQTGNDSLSVTLSREEIDTNDENAKIILKHFELFAKRLIKDINQSIKNIEELETTVLEKLISQININPTSDKEAETRFLIIDDVINDESWILKEQGNSYLSFISELKKNIAIVDLSSGEVVDIDENIKDTTLFDYLKNNLVDFNFKNLNHISVFTEKEYSLIREIIVENNFQYLFNNFSSSHSSGGKIIDDLFEQSDVNSTKRFNINNIYVKSSVFSRKDFDEQDIDAILSNKKTLVKNLFNIDGYESVTNNKILFVKNSTDSYAVNVKIADYTNLKREFESYVVSYFLKRVRHNAKLIYKTLKDFVDNIEKEKEQKLIKEKEKQKQLEIKERQEEIKNIKNKLYALMKDNDAINLKAIFDVYQENNIQHDIHYNQDNSYFFVREIKLLNSFFEQETISLPTTISHDDLKQLKRMRGRSNNYQVKLFINEFLNRYTKFNNVVNNVICDEHNKFYFSCDAEQLLFKIMINSNMKIKFVDNNEVVSTINVSSIDEYLQQEIQRVIKSVFYKRLVFNELLKQIQDKNTDLNNVVANLSLLKNNLIDTLLKYVPKDSSSLKITSKNVLSVLNINEQFKGDFDCVFIAEKVNELIKTDFKNAFCEKDLVFKRNKIDLLDNFDIKSLNILPEFLLDIDDDEQQYSVNFEREINCLKDIDFELYIKHYSKYVDKLEKSSKLFLSNEQIEYLDQATLFFLKNIYDAFANKDGTIFSEKDMIGTIKSKYLFVHQELIYLIKKLLSQKIEEFKDKYNYKKYSLDVLTYFKILYFIERSHEVKKQD